MQYNTLADSSFIQRQFAQKTGYKCDLQNPRTFNEKIQYFKLNNRDPIFTDLADKLVVRDFVRAKCPELSLPRVFEVFEDAFDIEPRHLQINDGKIVVKTNHMSGSNMLPHELEDMDLRQLQNHYAFLLDLNFYHLLRESHYSSIRRRIFIEEFLGGGNDLAPDDYKIHCFHGVPDTIQHDVGRFSEHQRCFYSIDWKLVDLDFLDEGHAKQKTNKVASPPPKLLSKMLEYSRKLSAGFSFVRVDFYIVNDEIFFGELTFTPGGGFDAFEPGEIDLAWGEKMLGPSITYEPDEIGQQSRS
ncbi:hypothetical protein N9052_00665 [bacterium]|nr:hypothetical protein [bacterium]